MKKNFSKSKAILARAEKFIKRGNYALAQKEFTKAYKINKDTAIIAEIEYCRQEAAIIKAKDLVKRGRKYLKKSNKRGACRCFEEAYAITGEQWLAERIDQLSEAVAGIDVESDARQAEVNGDYLKAAKLYDRSCDFNAGSVRFNHLKKRQAFCLVKAGQYEQAIECYDYILEKLNSLAFESSPESAYNYGFALASQGRYFRCLKIWDRIESDEKTFLKQKEIVARLLETNIYQLLYEQEQAKATGKTKNLLNYPRDLAAAYEASCHLQSHFDFFKNIDRLKTYCQWRLIEFFWTEEQYEEVAKIIFYPSANNKSATPLSLILKKEGMKTEILANLARISYKCAEATGRHLDELALYWFTALYHPSAWKSFSDTDFKNDESEKKAEVRQQLITMADAIWNYTGRNHTEDSLQSYGEAKSFWNIEKQLITDIDSLVGGRKEIAHLVCTPRFAIHLGVSDQVLELIRGAKTSADADSRKTPYFKNREHYLKTGSYYSAVGKSLYYLKVRAYKKALDSLPETSQNEFENYGILKVKYTYGLYCLETGAEPPGRYFASGPALFAIVPDYAAELVKKAEEVADLDALARYEEALNGIYTQTLKEKSEPLIQIQKVLSLVMSRRAVKLFNKRMMNNKTLSITLKKALKLNPQNEFARGILEETKAELEILEMEKALNRFKMHKACKIAVDSEYPNVAEAFFEYMAFGIKDIHESSHDTSHKLLILNETYDWCVWVDDTHPILDEIEALIEKLGGEVPR
ncbi:hypothetical protein QUF90_13985 [Desulfococcaceae bacterium HSG9]|nr:hypothetical protein [Desulfococcaceae bacterium HSG9]